MNNRLIAVVIGLVSLIAAVYAAFVMSGPPTLLDATDRPWLQSADRKFKLEIERPLLTSIDKVTLRYTRHNWPPDFADRNALSPGDSSISSAGGSVTAEKLKVELAAQDLKTAPRSHHVYYQWEVEYSRPLGLGGNAMVTARQDFVIGCTDAMLAEQLRNQRDHYLPIYDVPDPSGGSSPPHRSHQWVTLQDMGFGVSSLPPALHGFTGLWPTGLEVNNFLPTVALYKPDGKKPGGSESDAQYLERITDTVKDTPYTFIGWTFGAPYRTNLPPAFGCIPSSAWFIHDAGYHLSDGSMVVQPTAESIPGERDDFPMFVCGLIPELPMPENTVEPPFPTLCAVRAGTATPRTEPRIVNYYHGRGWGVHMWLDPDDPAGGTPTISLEAPGAAESETPVIPGLAVPGLFIENKMWD